jgi:hypothetical protein
MTTKTVYNYDSKSFRYLGEGTAFESPLEEGVYHYPANSTTVAVPEYTPQVAHAVWNGERWNVVALSTPEPGSAESEMTSWQQYQMNVVKVLSHSDAVMTGILDAVILGLNTFDSPDVVAFVQWRMKLKAILNILEGDANIEVPKMPPLPKGLTPEAFNVLPKKG